MANYTPDGSSGYRTPYNTPANGDLDEAASFNSAVEQLADNIEYAARGRLDRWYHADLGSIRYNANNRFAEYYDEGGTGNFGWGQGSVADAGYAIFSLPDLPPNGRITAIECEVNGSGAGSSHSATPSARPQAYLARKPPDASALTVMSGDFDAEDDVDYPDYDSAHAFSDTGSHDIDPEASYYVVFRGESGPNSVAAALLLSRISVYVERKAAT